ncbi:type I-E CRISPR-associated protein Cse1/CasA [Paeniglutamicibacter sp. NPDC091659]|uniref:type I-E CRISPR-associated protein Cse1/CasA n=1 Tax=Paeniglutamicibacter sp. NPDC091659 TaxID=3364389 RepID=UPI003812ECC4
MNDVSPTRSSFSLIDDAWVPVQLLDGTLGEVGIRDLFAQAHSIRGLSNEIPTLDFAILRVLLAVARQAIGAVEQPLATWKELWERTDFTDARIEKYLVGEKVSQRFDLLDPAQPFMQTPSLETQKGEFDSPARLIPDIPAGHQYFTTRSGSGSSRLPFREAARWLIHLQAFDYSGIKPGALGDSRVKGGKGYPIGTGWAGQLGGIYAVGANLFETLMLNLRFAKLGTDEDEDSAVWERTVSTSAATRGDGRTPVKGDPAPPLPVGDSDIFTWQSRRVLLQHDSDGVTAALVTNGDRLLPQNAHIFEPMSLWRDSPAQATVHKIPVFMPRRHDPAKAAWRGLGSILGDQAQIAAGGRHESPRVLQQIEQLVHNGYLPKGYSFSTALVGFNYGTQDSSFDDLYSDDLTIVASLLMSTAEAQQQEVLAAARHTDYAVKDLGELAKNILIAGGNDRPSDPTGVLAAAYFDFDHEFRNWLAKVSEASNTDEIRAEWGRRARTLLAKHSSRLMSHASERSILGVQDKDGHWNTAHTALARFNAALRRNFPSDTDVPPNSPPPAKEKANV